jgi:hypothetical protein
MNITGPQSNGANSSLTITEGSMNVDTDGGPNLAMSVEYADAMTFNASQHLRSLSIYGTTTRLAADGNRKIVTPSVSLNDNGKLDLTNNKLIVTNGSLGSWNGSAYTGVTGLLQSGRGDGSWNGVGIITSQTNATTSVLTTLAIASADELGVTEWYGESVDFDDVLIAYTWGGDADLNGELNGDDYFFIDSNVANSGSVFGYHQGDFDLNGEINGDDYFIIDGNITAAQAAGGPPPSLAAVPEPSALALLLAGPLLARRRRVRG